MPVNILNSNLGVSGVLPPADNNHLLEPNGTVSSLAPEIKLQSLFEGNGFDKAINANFMPQIPDEALLKPVVFNHNLERAFKKLKQIKDSEVRHFINEDLVPLLENKELLNAYLGMMVGG